MSSTHEIRASWGGSWFWPHFIQCRNELRGSWRTDYQGACFVWFNIAPGILGASLAWQTDGGIWMEMEVVLWCVVSCCQRSQITLHHRLTNVSR